MPSSRWKRFAFFDRNNLNLPSEVLEDLIPIGGTSRSSSATIRRGQSSSSSSSAPAAIVVADEIVSSNDAVSLVVTTAALPLTSKPSPSGGGGGGGINVGNQFTTNNTRNSNKDGGADYALALNDMWSSVAACNPMDLPSVGTTTAIGGGQPQQQRNIKLPSQAQTIEDDSNVVSGGSAVDGLVLVFVTSQDTDLVHCFDVTVRCNPRPPRPSPPPLVPPKNPSSVSTTTATTTITTTTATATMEKDLEDLDGWRGYIAPLKGHPSRKLPPNNNNSTTSGSAAVPRALEERIIAEHLNTSGGGGTGPAGGAKEEKEGIIGIATCRANSGHRPVHMACVTHRNVVVCVDPHLFLSW
jgi:hypothetical protein